VYLYSYTYNIYHVSVAVWYKECVCGLSLAGIEGSNPSVSWGILSLVNVVRCKVEVSATGRSLDQRIRTDCGLSVYDRGTLDRRSRPTKAVEPLINTKFIIHCQRKTSLKQEALRRI